MFLSSRLQEAWRSESHASNDVVKMIVHVPNDVIDLYSFSMIALNAIVLPY